MIWLGLAAMAATMFSAGWVVGASWAIKDRLDEDEPSGGMSRIPRAGIKRSIAGRN